MHCGRREKSTFKLPALTILSSIQRKLQLSLEQNGKLDRVADPIMENTNQNVLVLDPVWLGWTIQKTFHHVDGNLCVVGFY